MSREFKKIFSVSAGMIATKRKQEFCITISLLLQKISFSLMRSISLCIPVSPGKNLNQEEMMNVENCIEMSESLLKVHKQ